MRPLAPARRVPVAWAVLLALLVAGTVTLWWLDHRHDQTVAARAGARAAVTRALPEVLSYDYRSMGTDLAEAQADLTGRFEREFTRLARQRIAPAAKRNRVRTSARVTAAGVGRAEPGRAVALVFVTQTTRSAALPDPLVDSNRVRVTLTEVDGRWLISALTPV